MSDVSGYREIPGCTIRGILCGINRVLEPLFCINYRIRYIAAGDELQYAAVTKP